MTHNVSKVERFVVTRGQREGLHFLEGAAENHAVSTISREHLESGWAEVTDKYKGFVTDNPGGRAFRSSHQGTDYVTFVSKGGYPPVVRSSRRFSF